MTRISFLNGSSQAGLALSAVFPIFASVYSFLPSNSVSTITATSADHSLPLGNTLEQSSPLENKDSRGFVSIGFSNSHEEKAFENMYQRHSDSRWCKFHIKRGEETKSLDEIKQLSDSEQRNWLKDVSLAAYKLMKHNINKACYEAKYGGKVYIEIKERTVKGIRFHDFFLRIGEEKNKYMERFLSYRK